MDEKIESKGKVCVTGASGFLASWLVKRLLLSGYHVIGTVRDPENGNKLAHLWRLEGAKERLKLLKADLMEENSFDTAIMGCEGVFHTASPVLKPLSDPKLVTTYILIIFLSHITNVQCVELRRPIRSSVPLKAEILQPATEGTLNVLRSCKKNPALRRVVLTSSSSTLVVRDEFDPKVPLDESTWSSLERCEKLGERFQYWYPLSKVSAERAAWDFCNKNGIDLVTVIPSFVVGPSLPPDLCSTAAEVLELLKGEAEKFNWYGRMGYVHIDDVALCHILVYEHKSSNGRYLCSSIVLDNNELVSILSARYPSLPIPKRFELQNRPFYEFNTSKLKSLGFKFKTIHEMFDDCIASLVEQGYLSQL